MIAAPLPRRRPRGRPHPCYEHRRPDPTPPPGFLSKNSTWDWVAEQTLLGRDTVSGEWADTAVGLDGNHAKVAVSRRRTAKVASNSSSTSTPTRSTPAPTQPNDIGMHRVAFTVDDVDEAVKIAARHGCHPLRGVATYGDVYKLTYVRS
jgi:glyoxylase I family protein